MKKNIKPTNISAKYYLQNEVTKAKQVLAGDGIKETVDCFIQINKGNQNSKTEKRKTVPAKSMPKNTLHTQHLNTHGCTEKKTAMMTQWK